MTIVAKSAHLTAEMSGEAVILDTEKGVYFGLNKVGARVWQLIQHPKTLDEVVDAVVAEFDVAPADARRDIEELVRDLTEQELISVTGSAGAPSPR